MIGYSPIMGGRVRACFELLCMLAVIVDLTFHDLCHEGISRLFEQRNQIQEVALVSGHKSWKNLARYTQLKAVTLHRNGVEANRVNSKLVLRSDRR